MYRVYAHHHLKEYALAAEDLVSFLCLATATEATEPLEIDVDATLANMGAIVHVVDEYPSPPWRGYWHVEEGNRVFVPWVMTFSFFTGRECQLKGEPLRKAALLARAITKGVIVKDEDGKWSELPGLDGLIDYQYDVLGVAGEKRPREPKTSLLRYFMRDKLKLSQTLVVETIAAAIPAADGDAAVNGDGPANAPQQVKVTLSPIAVTILALTVTEINDIVDQLKRQLPRRGQHGRVRFPEEVQLAALVVDAKKQLARHNDEKRGGARSSSLKGDNEQLVKTVAELKAQIAAQNASTIRLAGALKLLRIDALRKCWRENLGGEGKLPPQESNDEAERTELVEGILVQLGVMPSPVPLPAVPVTAVDAEAAPDDS